MSVEGLANDNLAQLDDVQIREYAEMAQAEIERLEGLVVDLTDALWNWWGDGSDADDEHADWCEFDNVPADCLCGRSLFPEAKTNE